VIELFRIFEMKGGFEIVYFDKRIICTSEKEIMKELKHYLKKVKKRRESELKRLRK